MRRIGFIILAMTFGAAPAWGSVYFPAWTGSERVYGGSPREIAVVHSLILQDSTDATGPLYLWKGLGETRLVRLEADRVVAVGDSGTSLLFDFAAEVGDAWEISTRADDLLSGSTLTVVSRSEAVDIGRNRYHDVIHLGVTPRPGLADAGYTDFWFAPGVGLLRYAETTIAGPQTYALAVGAEISPDDDLGVPWPEPVAKDDLFPVGIGRSWTYAGHPLEMAPTLRMHDGRLTSDGTVIVWDGFQGVREIRRTPGGVEQWAEGAWRLLFDLDAVEGDSWRIDLGAQSEDLLHGSTVTVVSRSAEVRVPYGAFRDAVHLRIQADPGLADAGVQEAWLAPGVGLVKWTETTIAGPQTYDLVAFANRYEPPVIVYPDSGVVIGPEPSDVPAMEDLANVAAVERHGVRYEVGADRETYAASGAMLFRYRVTALAQPVTYEFGSGQQVDWAIETVDGRRYWTWSEVRSFIQVLTSFRLEPGESKEFADILALPSVRVPPGDYRLIGFLPTAAFRSDGVPQGDTVVGTPFTIAGDVTRATLEGTVSRVDGADGAEPVEGAGISMQLDGSFGVHAFGAQTDRDGFFAITGLMPGSYVLHVRGKGIASHTQRIELAAGRNEVRIGVKSAEVDAYANAHSVPHGTLSVELATDRIRYAAGDSVLVRYRATNFTRTAQRLHFPSGQVYDLAVDGPNGHLWQWSATRHFTAAERTQEILPGETFSFTEAFALDPAWVRGESSFVLRAALATSGSDGSLRRGETEGIVKFAGVGEVVLPPPGIPRPVTADMKTDRARYELEDSIDVAYRLINFSEEDVVLPFSSGQRYDLQLQGPSGIVWTWSADKRFTDEAGVLTLAPRDTFAFKERVRIPADTGTLEAGLYTLTAHLATSDVEQGTVDRRATSAFARFSIETLRDTTETPVLEPPTPLPPQGRIRARIDASAVGDSVLVSYVAVNVTEETLELNYRTGQQHDFTISDGVDEIWRWSDGRGFTDAPWSQALAPGDSLVIREAALRPGAAPEGSYVVSGWLDVTADSALDVSARETRAYLKFEVDASGAVRGLTRNDTTTPTSERRSDFDGSGRIDFDDFIAFARRFGKRSNDLDYSEVFDLDGDGLVGFSDFLELAMNFGK